MISIIPAFSTPFDETRRFTWNVENIVTRKMEFPYYVGEGPLYWYRIDWYNSDCSPNPCIEVAPVISYIKPNCPYEIIEQCLILPPSCSCLPDCVPGTCVPVEHEVWHMMATSVIHLCERINQECCHRKPPGFMRRVQQYMRPVLCCDVEAHGASDEWVDVDFLKCECGNLVDPCVAVIIYPCHVNRCGIHGPAFSGGPVPPINTIKMAPDILGHMPMAISTPVSAIPRDGTNINLIPPVKEVQSSKIVNKYGTTIPEAITCQHNLGQMHLLNDFLKLNKMKFDKMILYYNKEHNSWRGLQTFKGWRISLEWLPYQDSTKNGYKVNLAVERLTAKPLRTKLALFVKVEDFTNHKNQFEVNFKFNTKTEALTATKSFLQSKVIKDDVGLFRDGINLSFNLKG